MYIYLMDDVDSLDFQNLEVISSIENLINTAYEGCNIIDAKRSTFKYLQGLDVFGKATLQKLKQIIDFNNEYYPLYDDVDCKICVSGLASSFYKDGNNWVIPLSSFNYGNFSGLELLAEDESDAKLLIHAIKHYQLLHSNLKNFNISVVPSNGGGANIKKIINTKIDAKEKILVCFCDSDRFSLKSEFGSVTKDCKEISNQSDFPCFFFHTEGREIENDLPFYFIDEILTYQNNPDVISLFLKIKTINEIDRDIIKYYDFKEGILFKDIQHITCAISKDFWQATIEKLDSAGLLEVEKNNLKDTDIIIPHISKSIAANVLDWLDFKFDRKPKKVHEVIKNDNDAQAWLTHGEKLFWLASGMKKGRI